MKVQNSFVRWVVQSGVKLLINVYAWIRGARNE